MKLSWVPLLFASLAHAADAPHGKIAGDVIDLGSRAPLEGATVVLTTSVPSPLVVGASTDAAGHFEIPGLEAGSYQVMVVFGESRKLVPEIVVATDGTARVAVGLDVRPDETTIVERAMPHTPPAAIRSTVSPILPYSDYAIEHDRWAVGWLLLDIDAAGVVTGFRFLHRPGIGLDDIARDEAWKLRFEPARDADGRPVPSQRLWKLEWPSYWWQKDRNGMLRAGPTDQVLPERAAVLYGRFLLPHMRALPPCRLAGPTPFADGSTNVPGLPAGDTVHSFAASSASLYLPAAANTVYRDCSPPDLASADREPLIVRPAKP
jgi:carboxypeptidase family protein